MIKKISKAEARRFFQGGGTFRRIEDGSRGLGENCAIERVEVTPHGDFFEWRGETGGHWGRGYYDDAQGIERVGDDRVAFRYRWGLVVYEKERSQR